MTATEQIPCMEYTPIDFGWKLSESKDFLEIDWFRGEQVPVEIDAFSGTDSIAENDDDENESDTDFNETDESESDEEGNTDIEL